MAAKTITGKITKAYSPSRKSGYKKFYAELETDDQLWHVYARADEDLLEGIVKGNEVELTGNVKGDWIYPEAVKVIETAWIPEQELTFEVGHVGRAKQTKFGSGFYANTGGSNDWIVIPVDAAESYFGRPLKGIFPRSGRGTLRATAKVNGSTVVTSIIDWTPTTKDVDLKIPFSDIRWSDTMITLPDIEGQRIDLASLDIPFKVEPDIMADLNAKLIVRLTQTAWSAGLNRVRWTIDNVEVLGQEAADEIETLIYNRTVDRAVSKVRRELKELEAKHVAVDLTQVVDLFLNQGLSEKDAQDKAEDAWAEGYDQAFLEALKSLNPERTWRSAGGFFLKIGDYIIWERCEKGAATYIIPATPNTDILGQNLSLTEWVSTLSRILPWINKMDLRYGTAGQALAGTEEGVQFAIHAKDDDGEFDNWIQSVQVAISKAQTPRGQTHDLPSLDDILLLEAENE